MTSIALGDREKNENPALYWLSAVSVLLLVVGLANAATLLMVQRARRRREYSVRAALGATRGRFLATIALEAAILSTTAAVAALLLASWFAEALRYFLLPSLGERVGWDAHSIGAAILAGFATFIVTSIVGVLQLPSLVRLEHLTAGSGGHWRRSAAQSELILIQTTLAVMLVVGAGLFARSYREQVTQDLGMRVEDLFLVEFDLGEVKPRQDELLTQAATVLRKVPAIVNVTPVQVLPLIGLMGIPMSVPGVSGLPTLDGYEPQMHAATPELFDMLRLRLVEGRRLNTQDDTGPPVAVVNETMARTLWPGPSAIGKCFRIGFDPTYDPAIATSPPTPPAMAPCLEVVGVVRDVRRATPRWGTRRFMQYYMPISQIPTLPARMGRVPRIFALLVEAKGGTARVSGIIRDALRREDTNVSSLHVTRYADLLKPPVMGVTLFALFGALALAVAGVGLYATFAHAVVERRREMAIRLAVGARPSGVLGMILTEGTSLAMRGVVCGCVTAAIAGRWIQSFLFGTASLDPIVLGSSGVIMVCVAIVGTYIPARSAARTDLGLLLRSE